MKKNVCYSKATKRKYTKNQKEETPMKYVCDICGWEYDPEVGHPESGIAPGTPWEEVPEGFQCPLCFADREQFSEL